LKDASVVKPWLSVAVMSLVEPASLSGIDGMIIWAVKVPFVVDGVIFMGLGIIITGRPSNVMVMVSAVELVKPFPVTVTTRPEGPSL